MREGTLAAEGITAGYGKAEIVHDVSIEIRERELVAIVGPNGSGKSTFIKAVYGLATLFAGHVLLDGVEITHMEPEVKTRLGLGYVPQVQNVFRNLTVLENLEMGAYARSDANVRGDAAAILGLFPELKSRARQKAGTLSGGERQMLAIGRALMNHPRMLFLDEPAAALAPKLVSNLFSKIREIVNRGAGVVLVEQHARRALQVADRGYVFTAGRKVLEGTGPDLLANEEFVKTFLGRR